jgi:hypothetical protein
MRWLLVRWWVWVGVGTVVVGLYERVSCMLGGWVVG